MPSWLKTILESPDRLASIITWANWGLVTTLLIGALLTAFVIWAGSVRDELLKAQAAPRGLSAAQEGILSADMGPLGHQRIDFFLYPNDPEILGIAEPIARALERDGWPVVAFQPLGGGNVSGMLVEYDPTNPDATRRATALVASLSRLRLAVQGPAATLPTPTAQIPAYLGPNNMHVEASIRLTIGRKP
jgi:hypothetical protein